MTRKRKIGPLASLMLDSLLRIIRRPIYWVGFFAMPLFIFLFLSSMMHNGLPEKIPSAIVDHDGTPLSRSITQNLAGMQMVDIKQSCTSYTEARHSVQRGEIYGFFMIPQNFQADMLTGKKPVITFYTNTTYYVPAALLFKTFKSTALFAKAGIALEVIQTAGLASVDVTPLLNPINVVTRPIGNPQLNYAIYLCNSFIPCALQLMIFLVTAFSLGQDIKYGRSRELLRRSGDSVMVYLFTKLLPETLIWWVIAVFMESWLYRWNGYPMHGSWFWLTLSELMFVLASQCFAIFIFCVLPNLRLSLSVCALLGILSFSLAAFSFPEQSMYGGLRIFCWILPTRYNFLIYSDQALNGLDIYYSRIWFAAYCVFMLLPFTMLWRLKKELQRQVYVP
ncbi:MAG: ABC transporter permease [Prevotella sp.]|nr:ABC transporter permease [Bacteroides sp.]MCM1365751.1 ABC transporter permease [Prevotella sp.]MCM1436421.1 ABC transporter permease [Prevotella sp.]